FDGIRLFRKSSSQRIHSDWATLKFFDDGQQQLAINVVETVLVDFEHLQRRLRSGLIDFAVPANLGIIAHAAQQTVRDAGCSTTTAGDFQGTGSVDSHVENFRGALDDDLQIFMSVELQAKHDAET